MGRDIELHTEIKVNGVWHHYSKPRLDRSEGLWDYLKEHPEVAQRDLPEDATFTTVFCHYAEEIVAHDETYLNAAEIAELDDWVEAHHRMQPKLPGASFHPKLDYLFGNSWAGFHKWPDERTTSYPAEIEDIRFILWFDN